MHCLKPSSIRGIRGVKNYSSWAVNNNLIVCVVRLPHPLCFKWMNEWMNKPRTMLHTLDNEKSKQIYALTENSLYIVYVIQICCTHIFIYTNIIFITIAYHRFCFCIIWYIQPWKYKHSKIQRWVVWQDRNSLRWKVLSSALLVTRYDIYALWLFQRLTCR